MIKLILTVIPYLSYCQSIIQDAFEITDPAEEQILVCSMLLEEADRISKKDFNKDLLLAVSWEETRFFMKNKPNKSNCAGPLQIKIKYWCPNFKNQWSIHSDDGVLTNCDLIERGLFAFNYIFTKKNTLTKNICLYGPAKKCDAWQKSKYSRRYVLAVLKNLRKIQKIGFKYE